MKDLVRDLRMIKDKSAPSVSPVVAGEAAIL
jgi:hypothetical protein